MRRRLRSPAESFGGDSEGALLRATSAYQVLSCMGHVFSDGSDPVGVEHTTDVVDTVDLFISHSWSAGRWVKTLALCYYLNVAMATKACLAVFFCASLLLRVLGSPETWAGNALLPQLTVDLPMIVFFTVFFFGHRLTCGRWCPTMWLDKLCIPQTDDVGKAEAIQALPEFVANASHMLVLWDSTYFERLWCNIEIAIFTGGHDTESLTILPLWLAPWLLYIIMLEWFCARCMQPFAYSLLSQTGAEWYWAPPITPAKMIIQNVIYTLAMAAAQFPAVMLSLVAFRFKLHIHTSMLKQLSEFDVRTTSKCSVPSDRPILQDLLARMHDGIDDEPVSVAIEAPEYEAARLLHRRSPLQNREMSELLRTGSGSVRKLTSYPSHEEALDVFNNVVRERLHSFVLRDSGAATTLRLRLAVLAFLPDVFWQCQTTFLTCDGLPCEQDAALQGFASVPQMYAFVALGCLALNWVAFPCMLVCLLKVMDVAMQVVSYLPFQMMLAVVMGAASSALILASFGIFTACMQGSMTEELKLPFVAGLIMSVLLFVWLWCCCFPDREWCSASPGSSSRRLCCPT